MRFYTNQHKYYCGIDLHARKMYVCILDEKGEIREHRNMKTDRDAFLKLLLPFVRTLLSRRMHLHLVLGSRSLSHQGSPLSSDRPRKISQTPPKETFQGEPET